MITLANLEVLGQIHTNPKTGGESPLHVFLNRQVMNFKLSKVTNHKTLLKRFHVYFADMKLTAITTAKVHLCQKEIAKATLVLRAEGSSIDMTAPLS